MNEINSKEWDIRLGTNLIGIIRPNNIDIEKSGEGKTKIPATNPNIIDINIFLLFIIFP